MTVDAESRESKTRVRLHREDPEGYGRNRFILSLLAVSLHRGEMQVVEKADIYA